MAFDPREVLARNRADAAKISERIGLARTRKMLMRAQEELDAKLRGLGAGDQTFTATQMRTTLAQIEDVLAGVSGSMKTLIVGQSATSAEMAAGGILEYLERADMSFRGVGQQPLAFDEATMFDAARSGAKSSILRRLTSDESAGIPGAKKTKTGILERYGENVIGNFEETLQRGLLTRKSVADMRDEITQASPFLEGAPASWAERIVRTELMGAYNRAGWETMREANDQMGGDMVKILSATFDNRTASDSYAVHGQIREPDQAFETWYGMMQHPPARPNDREIIVPHSKTWPIPKYLEPRSDAEVMLRWKMERRKGMPPKRPQMETVPRKSFGQ